MKLICYIKKYYYMCINLHHQNKYNKLIKNKSFSFDKMFKFYMNIDRIFYIESIKLLYSSMCIIINNRLKLYKHFNIEQKYDRFGFIRYDVNVEKYSLSYRKMSYTYYYHDNNLYKLINKIKNIIG